MSTLMRNTRWLLRKIVLSFLIAFTCLFYFFDRKAFGELIKDCVRMIKGI